jgi:hypothetical protein
MAGQHWQNFHTHFPRKRCPSGITGTQHGFARPLRFEPLEDRRLLSITVNTLVDENNGIGVGGISLRDAIAAAVSRLALGPLIVRLLFIVRLPFAAERRIVTGLPLVSDAAKLPHHSGPPPRAHRSVAIRRCRRLNCPF